MEQKTNQDFKSFADFLKQRSSFMAATFLPLSEKQKQAYLTRIEDKVRIYQPKIEQKTGINLGKIHVLPNMLHCYQHIYNAYYKLANAQDFPEYFKIPFKTEAQQESVVQLAKVLAIPLTLIFMPVIAAGAKFMDHVAYLAAKDDCVLVPLGIQTRQELSYEKFGKNIHLDEKVVHELSHILWNRIEDSSGYAQRDFSLISDTWAEGFATYCHEEYFSDLYPRGYSVDKELVAGIYKKGKDRVQQVVNRYGIKALGVIPTQWQEFEEMFKEDM